MKEKQTYQFPFHFGQEAESYTFYRVPKILFTAEIFDHLSTDSKLLYGILLDRMQLSVRNQWIDDDGKVFIFFPQQNIMDALTCGNKKAGQLLAELDDKNGIGLISRVHQGLGRPDRIYVHKCIVPDMAVRGSSDIGMENSSVGTENSPGGIENTPPDMLKGHVQRCQNDMSRDVETTCPDVSKRQCNDTEGIKPEIIDTELNDTEISDTDRILSKSGTRQARRNSPTEERTDRIDQMDAYHSYRIYFERQCGLEDLLASNPYHTEVINEILELLVDTCCSDLPRIRIGGEEKAAQVVKSRFMKLDGEHIQYVLDCFTKNTTKIRNIKQYLLAALYNAPMTIGSYYTALVRHDMYGTE